MLRKPVYSKDAIPTSVLCEHCGTDAPVVTAKGESLAGIPVMESAGCGLTIGAGLHLLLCPIWPHLLCEHFSADGAPIHELPNGIYCGMETMHRAHIAIGGVATIGVAAWGLWRFCNKNPSATNFG
jgi:hypothetical protein